MHYRQMHELPYQSGLKEKFFSLGPVSLSLGESAWVALGLVVSRIMTQNISVLPFSFPFSHIHYALPIVAAYFMAKAKHPETSIPFWKYAIRWYEIRRRKRTFHYRKANISIAEREWSR